MALIKQEREKEKELNFNILYCKNALTFHQKGCVFDNLIEASKFLKQRGCACGLQLSNSIDCTYTKFVVCRVMLHWCSTWLDLSQVKKNYEKKKQVEKNCKKILVKRWLHFCTQILNIYSIRGSCISLLYLNLFLPFLPTFAVFKVWFPCLWPSWCIVFQLRGFFAKLWCYKFKRDNFYILSVLCNICFLSFSLCLTWKCWGFFCFDTTQCSFD